MGAMTLPPGFRFHPTDDELVGYYLKRKVDNLKIELEVIPVVHLYKSEPWELPEKSLLPRRDLEWFFFCPRDRKYPNGSRTNRATSTGYWKATGKDRRIACDGGVYGLRKTLVFYRGRAPGGERTAWVMHEYRLCQDLAHGTCNFIGAYALCRVIKRHEGGLPQGESCAKGAAGSARSGQMSKVSSSSSLVSNEQLSASFTPPPTLDVDVGTMVGSGNAFQSPVGYGYGVPTTATATATTAGLPSSALPPPPLIMPSPHDTFSIGGGGGDGDFLPAAAESRSHAHLLFDTVGMGMGGVSEQELKWDSFACPSTFSSGADMAAASPATLCRQASDGFDDLLAAFFFSDDNRIVF